MLPAYDYVVVGNSAAGVGGCEGIRRHDPRGTIALFSDEGNLAYSRCLLTHYISGRVKEERLRYRPAEFYEKNRIDLFRSTKVVQIHPQAKIVVLGDGSRIGYGKLLLATGSSAVLYDIPGKDLQGVFTLRTLADAERIMASVPGTKKAVIMGGGLVGINSAKCLQAKGLEVCMVVSSRYVLSQNIDAVAADIVTAHLRENGITMMLGTDVLEVIGREGRVAGVRLSDGRSVECQMVISAKGVKPNLELANSAGLSLHHGVLVDDRMRTSLPDIYAAGDVAEAREIINGEPTVLSIWPLAAEQGKVAGTNMAGGDMVYEGSIGMNAAEFFGLPVVSIGETTDHKAAEVEQLVELDPKAKVYRKLVLRGGKVIGALLVGDTSNAGIYKSIICTRLNVHAIRDLLLKQTFDYAKLVDSMLAKDDLYT